MLSPRTKKVLRDVWSNKTRTLLVVMSIAVGVLAVGTTLTIQDVLSREMTRNWIASQPASGSVTMEGFQQDFVNAVRTMPEISDAVGRNNLFAQGKNPNSTEEFKYFQLYAIGDFNDLRLNTFSKDNVAPEDYPPPKRSVLLGANSLAFLGVKMGDNVLIKMPDGKEHLLRVAGTVYSVDEGGGPFMFAGTGYMTLDTWEWLGQERAFGQLNFRVKERADDSTYIQGVADDIKKRVQNEGKGFYGANIPRNPDAHPAAESVTAIVALMTLLGAASLVMSGFLVINTVSAVLTQHVRQIGMMKAVGARTGQLSRMYLGMVLLFGMGSLFFALPLGMLGAYFVVQYLGVSLLNLRISSYLPPPSVFAVQLSIALVAPIVAAAAPILSGTRKTVREAISDYGMSAENDKGIRGLLLRLKARLGRTPASPKFIKAKPSLFSRPLVISLRNTVRRKGRLMMTLITLILGGAIFMGVMSARDGLNKTTDVALAYWGYDFDVNLSRAYPSEQIEREALSVPGVRKVETWGGGYARVVGEDRTLGSGFNLMGVPAETTLLNPILREGRWLLPDDQNSVVLNTDVTKDNPNIELGDVVRIKLNDTNTAELTVVGLVQGVLTGPFGYINKPAFARLAQTGGKDSFAVVQTDTQDAVAQANISRALQDKFKRANLQVGSTSLTANIRQSINTQFSVIVYLLLAMAILLAVVGGLGLAGTMSINVMERTREIGVMRAIGANNGAIRRIVIVEGVLIGFISWLVGAVLALPFSYAITSVLGSALQFEVFHAFSTISVLVWLVVVLLIATLASVLPAWNASRLTVNEVLAYS